MSRLLFVHAHPDDETLATGIAMAHHVVAGDDVHLLTCTLGEQGDVIPVHLRHLAADREDRLGAYRRKELRAAMAVLGVHEQVLGEHDGAGSVYRDSGMVGTSSLADPRCFARADARRAAAQVAEVIERLDPQVVVTYDKYGGYGHPDHIQTQRVTLAAVAALPKRVRPAVFSVLTPRTWARADRAWLAARVAPHRQPSLVVPGPEEEYPPGVVPDREVTHQVIDADVVGRRDLALREHLTQVSVFDGYYALSNDIAARLVDREGYARVDPASGALVSSGVGARARPGLLG